jgi:hypothetical protein
MHNIGVRHSIAERLGELAITGHQPGNLTINCKTHKRSFINVQNGSGRGHSPPLFRRQSQVNVLHFNLNSSRTYIP